MMFVHMIDECLERAKAELSIYQRKNLTEYAEHVERRIASLMRIRKYAPKAIFGSELVPWNDNQKGGFNHGQTNKRRNGNDYSF